MISLCKDKVKTPLKLDIILIVILSILLFILIVLCVFNNNTPLGNLFLSLAGAILGGLFTIVGVTISLNVERESQLNALRLDRMPLLAFETFSISLDNLKERQIFSIYKEGICTSGFPYEEPNKLYTGITVKLANNNPAFNVHICDAKIDDGFKRSDYKANNPLEVRLVGNEELKIMVCYMAYKDAVENGCTSNISGTICFQYEDVFANRYIQEVPVIFFEKSNIQNMEIRTIGQVKWQSHINS